MNILEKIIEDKKKWLKENQTKISMPKKSDLSFYESLKKQSPAFVLECKKASPSKGLIRKNFDLNFIASIYKNYASAISVLTDEKYFQGSFDYIKKIRNLVKQPILCKDFFISEYQILLARHNGADAILLMLSVLNNEEYLNLSRLANKLNMGILSEVSNEEELQRALSLDAKIIGINNRNLQNLEIDLNKSIILSKKIPKDKIIISESGINSNTQIRYLKKYVNGFLIGTNLMNQEDLDFAVRKIIFGENKICGLTNERDIKNSYSAGALYGGLIFAENSSRKIDAKKAKKIINKSPLKLIGVFQNQNIDFIVNLAQELNLFAVQLHGDEDENFIINLRKKLPEKCQIFKAISIDINDKKFPEIKEIDEIDKYILDSKVKGKSGGNAISFDWNLIPNNIKNKAILSGGINIKNINLAMKQNMIGLDINSGVEGISPLKDEKKINEIFKQIKAL